MNWPFQKQKGSIAQLEKELKLTDPSHRGLARSHWLKEVGAERTSVNTSVTGGRPKS